MRDLIKPLLPMPKEKKSRTKNSSSRKNFWQKIGCFPQEGARTKVTEYGLIVRPPIIYL